MARTEHKFDDGDAYEQYMGRWTRAAGSAFLEWLAPPAGASWLDVGCGTGAFTELVIDNCAPASVVAVDPAETQLDRAREKAVAQRVAFRVADAQNLPMADDAFDVVVAALVINFIPDRPKGISEMRRVCRPGGVVAGYVWDFVNDGQPARPIRQGLRAIGIEPEPVPGQAESDLASLQELFAGAGLENIAVQSTDLALSYSDFDNFWEMMTIRRTPAVKTILALPEADRARLIDAVRAELPPAEDGSVVCGACINAIKASAPN